jgi:hypothetical protein
MDALSYFTRLGELALRLWYEQDRDERAFPAVAARAFAELPPAQFVTAEGVLAAVLGRAARGEHAAAPQGSGVLPPQPFAAPGEPPTLLVFDRDRIGLMLRFWFDESLVIHQHEFSGAFHMLDGASVQSTYGFRREARINSGLYLGETRLTGMTVLRPGDTCPIVPGDAFIHALFHLDRPTATLTLQTKHEPDHRPQFSYMRPHVAYDPFLRDDAHVALRAGLDALLKTRSPRLFGQLRGLAATADFETTFVLLRHTYDALRAGGHLGDVVAAARARHGARIDGVIASLEEQAWVDNVANRREDVVAAEPRLLLAAALSASNRGEVLGFVASHHGCDLPAARGLVHAWVAQLVRARPDGAAELLGVELEAEAFAPRTGDVMAHMVASAVDGGGLDLARRRLAEVFPPRAVDENHDGLVELWAELSRGPLRPLFVD